MAQADMEERLEKLEHRTLAMEQILPTLATRQDLERFATKEDLTATSSRLEAIIESVRDDVRIVAEGVVTLVARLERKGVI